MAAVISAKDPITAPVRGAGLFVLALLASGVAWMSMTSHHPPSTSTGEAVAASTLLAGFQETTLIAGTATYYAEEFQGRIMASGTPFDVNDVSIAAANQWPLGTRLRLRRAPGGPYDATLSPAQRDKYFNHPVIVTVQDHGDFTHALDLSRAAFAQLGHPEEGVIQLLIEPLGTADTALPVTLVVHH